MSGILDHMIEEQALTTNQPVGRRGKKPTGEPVFHSPREVEKTDEEITTSEQALCKARQALARLEAGLEAHLSNIHAAAYGSRTTNGQIIPGIKMYEFDLKRTSDPKKQASLKEKIGITYEKLEAAQADYTRYLGTIQQQLEKQKAHVLELKHRITILKNRRVELQKDIVSVLPRVIEISKEQISLSEGARIAAALRAYLYPSKEHVLTEINEDSSRALRASIERYRENDEEELSQISRFLPGAGLSIGEVDLFYAKLVREQNSKGSTRPQPR